MLKNKLYLLIVLSLLITSCTDELLFGNAGIDNTTASVTIESNAFVIMVQDGVNSEWNALSIGNRAFDPRTISYVVNDPHKRITIGLLCPSSREHQPHRIHLFYALAAEVREFEYNCLRDVSESELLRNLYGNISGINTTAEEPELAYITVGTDNRIQAYDSYATTRPVNSGDILAYKGFANKEKEFKIEKFFRGQPSFNKALDQSARLDINFNCTSLTKPTCLVSSSAPSDEVQIIIDNAPLGTNWLSKAGFRNENNTYMQLFKQQNAAAFSYQGLPEYVIVDDAGNKSEDKSKTFIILPKEGHEVSAQTFNEKGLVTSEVISLSSLAKELTLSIPSVPSTIANVVLKANGELSDINVSWPNYSDQALGDASLFRWTFSGSPAKWKKKKDTDPDISQLEWRVAVSPHWFLANEAKTLRFIPPTSVSGWRNDLGFDASKPINWELSYLAGHKKMEELLEHIDLKIFIDGITYSQYIQRSVAVPGG